MVQLPALFQQAGWLVPSLAFIVAAVGTALAALFLGRTVTRVPGNGALELRIEYARLMGALLPRWLAAAGMVALVASFISQNVSNIIVASQVADDTFLVIGRTCALVLYPQPPPAPSGGGLVRGPLLCIDSNSETLIQDSPFGQDVYAISAGYLAVAAITVPLSYLSLDSNIIFQIVGVILIVLCQVIWTINLASLGLSSASLTAMAPAGSDGLAAYSSVLPTALFNFGFVASIPSWLNEKAPHVPSQRVVILAVTASTVLYLALGFVGAASTLNFSSGADLLSLLVNTDGIWLVSKIAVFVFPAANLMTSIPIFSLLVRYNLVNEGWLSAGPANAVGVGVPWLLSLFFYAGNQLGELVNWSSALLFVAVNLALPALLYLCQRGTSVARSTNAGGTLAGLAAAAREDAEESAAAAVLHASRGRAFIDADSDTGLLLSDYAGATSAINGAWSGAAAGSTGSPDGYAASAAAAATSDEEIRPTTACFRARVLGDTKLATLLFVASLVTAVAALALQIYQEVQNDTGGGSSGSR